MPESTSDGPPILRLGNGGRRDHSLEVLRGLAAFAVVFDHCLLGFLPDRLGLSPNAAIPNPYVGRLWFAAINGGAAVTFFFVLSGYVLTRRYFSTGDDLVLIRGVVKRWPRLMGPVGMACLLAWALFALGAYRYEQAAALTGSPWLANFAGMPIHDFQHTFVGSVAEGLFLTFFQGTYNYDTSLWTMRYEFVGSFIAFGLAFFVFHTKSEFLKLYLLMIVIVICMYINPFYCCFPLGVGLASFLPRRRRELSGQVFWPVMIVVFVAAGYSGRRVGVFTGAYDALHQIPIPYIHALIAMVLIAAIENCPRRVGDFLNSSRLAVWIGAISFPLYLVHVLVLTSLGSWVYVSIAGSAPSLRAAIPAILATVSVSTLAAVLGARADIAWTALVNRLSVLACARSAAFGTAAGHLQSLDHMKVGRTGA